MKNENEKLIDARDTLIPETKNPKFENEVVPHKDIEIPEFDESGDSLNNTISSVLENLREANRETIEELKAFLTDETQEKVHLSNHEKENSSFYQIR